MTFPSEESEYRAIAEALEDWEYENFGKDYILMVYDPEDAERIIKRNQKVDAERNEIT